MHAEVQKSVPNACVGLKGCSFTGMGDNMAAYLLFERGTPLLVKDKTTGKLVLIPELDPTLPNGGLQISKVVTLVKLIRTAATTIAEVHTKTGIAHFDLKLVNFVLVNGRSRLKPIDWGLAQKIVAGTKTLKLLGRKGGVENAHPLVKAIKAGGSSPLLITPTAVDFWA